MNVNSDKKIQDISNRLKSLSSMQKILVENINEISQDVEELRVLGNYSAEESHPLIQSSITEQENYDKSSEKTENDVPTRKNNIREQWIKRNEESTIKKWFKF